MGFVDKLKNIFFEEEEEEEIEDTRPLKRVTKEEVKEPKEKEVIAKKVEIPKRRHVEEIDDDEVVGELKFDIPKKEEYVEIPKEEVKEIKEVKKEQPKISEIIFDDEDFILDSKPKETVYKSRERESYIPKEVKEERKSEYKEEKPKGFTPSPIISPIYGILDKNYKKEEVKEKKEIRITSRVGKMDLDSVRNKAFGDLENELFAGGLDNNEKEEISKDDIKKAKDKIEDEGKPVIDKVTIGEAQEYYSDLGLAYNTDYKDVSKEINDGKIKDKEEKGDKLEDNLFDLIDTMYERDD